jgi:hypothetical protein
MNEERNMIKICAWERLGLLMAILISLSACRTTVAAPLPDTDIVFQAMIKEETPYIVGFINSDGSGLKYTEICSSPDGMPAFLSLTSGGELLLFHGTHGTNSRGTGPLSAITSAGYLVRYDEDLFWGAGWIAPIQNSHQVVIAMAYTGGRPESIENYIQQLDLEKKESIQTYVETTGTVLRIGTNALHKSILVYARIWLVDGDHPASEVVLLNVETEKETVLVAAESWLDTPAISPDGQWVAYTADDGLYVVSIEGSEPRRVVETCVARKQSGGWDDWPPAPSWAPDGQWLTYHRCTHPCFTECGGDIGDYSVFKVNLRTGEEVLLVEGGVNPYWRLGAPVAR